MKNKINKILLIISCVLIVSILFLAILGSIKRIGYLSEFKLNKSLSKKNAYFYDFRIKYYSKIFRNSDIYKVNFEIPKTAYINRKFVQFKNALFDKKGESPFASFTSTQELKYDDKINGINYTLQLKLPFYIILIIGLLYILINYKLIFYVLKQNKNLVLKIYKVSSISILLIIVILFILGKIEHKAALEDLELIADTKTGYTYKARIANKGLFSENIIYKYSDKPITLKNKPDYIKNYGYSLELNKPDWYDRKLSKIWNNTNGTFIISNNAPTYIVYRYDIELSMGEKYAVTLESRKLNTNISGSIKYHLNSGEQTEIPNTYKMTDNYEKYTSIMEVKKDITSEVPSIRFFLPQGVFDIKSIKVEQVSDSLYIKTDNTIIFTSNKKIENIQDIINIKYKLNLNSYLFILLIITASLIIIYINIKTIIKLLYIIYNKINNILDDCNNFLEKYVNKTYQSNNIYIIAFLLLFPFIFIIYQSIYSSYPYYVDWDSSQIYSKDILLVASGLFPEHLLHPNMIPLVLYKYIFIPIGKLLKIISISNIYELENSLNPHLAFTEFTEYILTICRISFFLFITIMYINIVKIMQIQNIIKNKFTIFIFSLSVLIILSISTFVYSAGIKLITVIRYETTGLLLASISLYFIISSSSVKKLDDNKHKLFLILSGVFVSAAVLSKIMFLGWIIGIFLIYILLNLDKYFFYKENKNIGCISNVLIFTTIFIILLNILISLSFNSGKLLPSAFIDRINKKYLVYAQIPIPAFFIILSLIIYLVKNNIIKTNYIIKIFLNNFLIYVLSCFYTILLALLLPMPVDTLFTTYIFSYSGGSILALINSAGSYSLFTQKVLWYMIFMFIISVLIFIYVIKNIRILFKNIFTINIIINITLIIISFLFIKALRAGSDKLITTSLLVVSIFIFVKNIFNILPNIKILKYIFFIILFVIAAKILVTNIRSIRYSPAASNYVYDVNTWKTYSYGKKNGIRFANLFKNSYPSNESWNYALFWARNIKQTRRLLTQVKINNNSLNDTIIAYSNSKIDKDGKNTISNIDDKLCGGLILPIKENNNRISLRADYDFFFISDIQYQKEDKRVKLTNYDFYIDDHKYYVYKLNMNTWRNGYNGNFTFIKNKDFNMGFILINDRFSKGL